MSDYITLSELKVSAELQGVSFGDYDGARAITSASRAIDEYCGRRFWTTAGTYTQRFYSPLDSYCVQIDDLVTLGTVQIDVDGDGTCETTLTQNTDFLLEPYNAAADSKPYEELRRHPLSGQLLPCWPRSVSVTGQFGWPDVPEQVKSATTMIAIKLFMRMRQAPFGVVGIGIDNTAVRISRSDPDLALLLDPLVRGQGVMVA